MTEPALSLSGSQAYSLLTSWLPHSFIHSLPHRNLGETSSLLSVSNFFHLWELGWEAALPPDIEGPIFLEGQPHVMQRHRHTDWISNSSQIQPTESTECGTQGWKGVG